MCCVHPLDPNESIKPKIIYLTAFLFFTQKFTVIQPACLFIIVIHKIKQNTLPCPKPTFSLAPSKSLSKTCCQFNQSKWRSSYCFTCLIWSEGVGPGPRLCWCIFMPFAIMKASFTSKRSLILQMNMCLWMGKEKKRKNLIYGRLFCEREEKQ